MSVCTRRRHTHVPLLQPPAPSRGGCGPRTGLAGFLTAWTPQPPAPALPTQVQAAGVAALEGGCRAGEGGLQGVALLPGQRGDGTVGLGRCQRALGQPGAP